MIKTMCARPLTSFAKLIGVAVMALPLVPVAAEELPRDVNQVLQQLEEFEAEERAKAEKTIEKKRLQVAKYLKGAIDRETKAGNLETALLIKGKMESLNPSPEAAPKKPALAGVGREADFLGNWTWFIPEQTLILEGDGKAFIQLPGGGAKLDASWRAAGDSGRAIIVNWGAKGESEARVSFNAGFTAADIKGNNHGNDFSTKLARVH